MLSAAGLGVGGGVLMAFGTLTTNFVNIYLSALAWKSLLPRSSEHVALWVTGLVGRAAVAALARVARPLRGFHAGAGRRLRARRRDPDRALLPGPAPAGRGGALRRARRARAASRLLPVGVLAWALGAAVYYTVGASGGTLPALGVALVVYAVASRALSGS
jgi:purine-cytosine permease-like protein